MKHQCFSCEYLGSLKQEAYRSAYEGNSEM